MIVTFQNQAFLYWDLLDCRKKPDAEIVINGRVGIRHESMLRPRYTKDILIITEDFYQCCYLTQGRVEPYVILSGVLNGNRYRRLMPWASLFTDFGSIYPEAGDGSCYKPLPIPASLNMTHKGVRYTNETQSVYLTFPRRITNP